MLPPEEPIYDPQEFYGIIPTSIRREAYDVREVIARLVDGSRFREFKAIVRHDAGVRLRADLWLSRRHHREQRRAVQRERVEGARTSSSCARARAFRCCSCKTSPASWWAGNTRRAASPRTARRWCMPSPTPNVPKFTVIIGGSFGAGNYGMCGRAYGPRFLWMWPNARISRDGRRTGRERAADRAARQPDGARRTDDARRRQAAFKAPTIAKYETEGNPYFSTARLWDDGIIDPLDTRARAGAGPGIRDARADPRDDVRRFSHVRKRGRSSRRCPDSFRHMKHPISWVNAPREWGVLGENGEPVLGGDGQRAILIRRVVPLCSPFPIQTPFRLYS